MNEEINNINFEDLQNTKPNSDDCLCKVID